MSSCRVHFFICVVSCFLPCFSYFFVSCQIRIRVMFVSYHHIVSRITRSTSNRALREVGTSQPLPYEGKEDWMWPFFKSHPKKNTHWSSSISTLSTKRKMCWIGNLSMPTIPNIQAPGLLEEDFEKLKDNVKDLAQVMQDFMERMLRNIKFGVRREPV